MIVTGVGRTKALRREQLAAPSVLQDYSMYVQLSVSVRVTDYSRCTHKPFKDYRTQPCRAINFNSRSPFHFRDRVSSLREIATSLWHLRAKRLRWAWPHHLGNPKMRRPARSHIGCHLPEKVKASSSTFFYSSLCKLVWKIAEQKNTTLDSQSTFSLPFGKGPRKTQ